MGLKRFSEARPPFCKDHAMTSPKVRRRGPYGNAATPRLLEKLFARGRFRTPPKEILGTHRLLARINEHRL